MATRNLNKIIDVNYYPVDKARNSNMRHRPIGLGVQVRPLDNPSGCVAFPSKPFGQPRMPSPLSSIQQSPLLGRICIV